jgi:hypothetical protein
MPSKRKKRTPPIIVNGKRYKYVESNGDVCDKCAGKDDWDVCERFPSCSDGGYFVEVNEEVPNSTRRTTIKATGGKPQGRKQTDDH